MRCQLDADLIPFSYFSKTIETHQFPIGILPLLLCSCSITTAQLVVIFSPPRLLESSNSCLALPLSR